MTTLLALWLYYAPTGYDAAMQACGDWRATRAWQQTGRCTVEVRRFEVVA